MKAMVQPIGRYILGFFFLLAVFVDTSATRWPHQLALLKLNHGNVYDYHCGATLITDRLDWTSSNALSAVTSAHCIWDDQTPGNYMLLGSVNRLDRTARAVFITIGDIIIHEEYKGHDSSYDIAVLTNLSNFLLSSFSGNDLSEPIEPPFSVQSDGENKEVLIGPISLSSGKFGRKRCTLLRWGQTETESAFELQEFHLKVIKRRRCRKFWPDVTKRQICAWNGPNSNQSACFGDSGAPLLCRNSKESLVLAGIISFGPEDCSSKPTVFVKISAFTKWIQDKISVP